MIDSIYHQYWQNALEKFKEYVIDSYSLESSATSNYLKIGSDFEIFINDCNLPPETALKSYYSQIIKKPAFCKPDDKQDERKARVLRIIWDIYNGNIPKLKYSYNSNPCPINFRQELIQYEALMVADQKSEGTICTRCGRIKVFFVFLNDNNCGTIADITAELLRRFIATLDGKYSAQGKTSILYTLRNFFSYQVFDQAIPFNPMTFLSGLHSRKHERLPSVYTTDEVQAVMDAVDRSTAWGKTIYLMMLLACVYGLRISDIKQFPLDSINWNDSTITISQYKTKQVVMFPLTDEVKFALLDYLKNVRPIVDYPQVFIRIREPHQPYSINDHFGGKLSIYFEKAGVNTTGKHHGLHSLRHSLATTLSADGIPVNEIATVMGHSSIASTKTYIWSDIERLRLATLEVPSYD